MMRNKVQQVRIKSTLLFYRTNLYYLNTNNFMYLCQRQDNITKLLDKYYIAVEITAWAIYESVFIMNNVDTYYNLAIHFLDK